MPVNYTIEKQLPSSVILHTLGHEIWKSHVSYSKEHYDKVKQTSERLKQANLNR